MIWQVLSAKASGRMGQAIRLIAVQVAVVMVWAIVFFAHPAVAELRPLPVPTLTLYPGDRISPDVMAGKVFSVNAASLQSYVVELRQLDGKYARRTLVAGQPIALASIKDRDAVQKGIAASAIYQSGGLVIKTVLMPLESGSAGALIQARNTDSGLIVQARVREDGSLLVGGQ
jgi:flagellar basal body P-ring formation protein FlgA